MLGGGARFSLSTDGPEMGKLLVAEGPGVTVLPELSVAGDPMERNGLIAYRPLAGDVSAVQIVIQRLRPGTPPRAARDLHRMFVHRARGVHAA